MKKVILSLAVLFSVAMVSCGGNKKAEAAVDSESILAVEAAGVEEVVDTTVNDSTLAETVVAAAAEVVEAPAAE